MSDISAALHRVHHCLLTFESPFREMASCRKDGSEHPRDLHTGARRAPHLQAQKTAVQILCSNKREDIVVTKSMDN